MIERGMTASELKSQHRMQPQVAKPIMSMLYPGLESRIGITDTCTMKGVSHNMFFITHEHLAEKVQACNVGWFHTLSVIYMPVFIIISVFLGDIM
jgi:hypothetical protein